MSTPNEKTALRKLCRERRAAIPLEEKKERDRRIVEHVAASAAFRDAETVLLYAPHGSEIVLLPLVRMARKLNKRVAFPRCDTETERMTFYYLEEDQRLLPGAYGIYEPPTDAKPYVPNAKDLCILPALAADRSGQRLGYGKGYYDKFLTEFPGTTLCAVYRELLIEALPADAHDRPVRLLCTEDGILRSTPQKKELPTPESKNNTEKDEATFPSSAPRNRFLAWLLAKDADGKWAYRTSPLLILATFLLLLLCRPIEAGLMHRGNEHLIVILMQVMVFTVPAVVYLKLRPEAFTHRLRMQAPRLRHTWFCVTALIVMITGGLLTEILTGGIANLGGGFTLYDTFVAKSSGSFASTLYLILAYAILPAFSEELIFRAILCADVEERGMSLSVLVSGLFFALLHFDLQFFLTYFLLGALLAGVMYITRSFFAPFALHLAYNLFCLFGQPYLSNFYNTAGSHKIFLFFVITLCLLFAAFAAGEARKILHVYAKRGEDSSFTSALPVQKLPAELLHVLLAPAPLACVLVWLVVAVIRLF